jgi:hypothetical protein
MDMNNMNNFTFSVHFMPIPNPKSFFFQLCISRLGEIESMPYNSSMVFGEFLKQNNPTAGSSWGVDIVTGTQPVISK